MTFTLCVCLCMCVCVVVKVPGEVSEGDVSMAGQKTVESMRAVGHVTIM